MANPRPNAERPLPRWLIVIGSVVVLGHLFVFGVHVLAARSGPWFTPFGRLTADPPKFAATIDGTTGRHYLRPLKLGHDYRFRSNEPGIPGVRLEVRLKDENGKVFQTVKLPDENANVWVRHRQSLLVQMLAPDMPVSAPRGEQAPAPGAKVPTVAIWELDGPNGVRLKHEPEHLLIDIEKRRGIMRPTDWSLLLVKSYARHLCREHGAKSAEVIRHTREPINSEIMLMREVPPLQTLAANYGEFTP